MDHLNYATLRWLPGSPQAVTARSTLELLRRTKLNHAAELRWGDTIRISTSQGEVLVEAFEVEHWGARWRHDRHRGYNGYIISREGRKILFGGDTAWTKSFRALRKKGPFDLALMPIGGYEPWVRSHCTPEQAVGMANDAGASRFLPIHFRTFSLGREPSNEPMERLEAAIESERIGWKHIGQTFTTAI
jgi:L-ascorbate metabolism protein UlaG (beta-lactamase superfamily)